MIACFPYERFCYLIAAGRMRLFVGLHPSICNMMFVRVCGDFFHFGPRWVADDPVKLLSGQHGAASIFEAWIVYERYDHEVGDSSIELVRILPESETESTTVALSSATAAMI